MVMTNVNGYHRAHLSDRCRCRAHERIRESLPGISAIGNGEMEENLHRCRDNPFDEIQGIVGDVWNRFPIVVVLVAC